MAGSDEYMLICSILLIVVYFIVTEISSEQCVLFKY